MSSSNLFGGYRSQTTYALQQISSSRYPDTNKDFERNIARLNQFVDYIASYLQTMQKGVDQANEDPITKLRSTVLDLGILLGGGELLYGINLGDLQYWLPALGAMFGFDSNQPLPLNLLYAAEHFFLGFIIPLDAWAPAVEDVIDGWAVAFGLPADFVASLHDLLDAIQSLTSDYLGLFNALWGILTIFNTLPGVDQGPFADLWSAVRTLLSGQGITALGSVVDPVFHSLAPWIEDLAILLNDWDTVVKAFTGGIYNAQSMVNLATMFANFTNMIPSGTFDPLTAWLGVFTGALTPAGVPGLDASKILTGTFGATQLQPLIDAISTGFGGSSGLNFTSLQSFISSIPSAQATIDKIYDTIMGVSTTGHSLTDLGVALATFPANFIQGVLTGGNIPSLDASKITTGTFLQALLPSITSSWGKTIDSSVLVNAISQALIPSLTSGWGGTIASSLLSGVLGSGLIPGLDASKIVSGTLAVARASWAAQIDTLVQAWGGTGSGFLPADLITFASAIPHDNLTGNLGGSNIANTIQNFLDGGIRGVQNNPALSGQSIAQWNNALTAAMGFLGWNPAGATPPNSVAAITSTNNQNLNNRAVQKNPFENIDPTIDATFPFNDVATLATLPTIAVTATTPVSAPIRIRDGGIKQSIRFKGYVSSGSLTGFYVNLYHVDPTTGAWTWFYSSTDYHASLATGATPQWNSLNLAAAAYVNAAQGDMIQAEITVTGGGTYTMVGKTLSNQLLPMPGAIPSLPAAQRYPTNTPTIVATGTGAFNGGPGTRNLNITVPANATCLFVPFQFYNTGSGGFTSSVAIGATNFNSINADQYRNNASQYAITLHGFYLMNPPTGPQTITFTFSGTGSLVMCGNPLAISNVSSVGSTVILGPASGTAIAQSINPADTNALYINLMGEEGGAGSTITYNSGGGTSLYSTPGISGSAYPFLVGSKSGVSPAAFAATASTSAAYGSIIVPFVGSYQPAPTTVANPSAPGTAGVTSYNRLQPWLGLAGSAGATQYSPVIDPYATPGSGISIQNPAVKYPWANNFDIVVCSDGSGGEGGGYPVGGVGGKAGTFARQTLTRAQIGTSNLTLNIGAGSAGTSPGVGGSSAAGGVSVVVPGWGTVSQAGAPGSGSGLSPSAYGVAGDSSSGITYNDANGTPVTFSGAAGGSGGQAPGGQPGAGGSGGNATYMPNFNGGPGGAAEVWIRSYQ